MGKTTIEWCTDTWNPIRARRKAGGKVGWHCEKVSAGCARCYAERFNGRSLPGGGTGLAYNKVDRELVETFVDTAMLGQPLRWRRPRKVFVCSMTDLFGEWVTDEQIAAVFGVMAACPQHTFMVLTKRPDRKRKFFEQLDPVSSFINAARRAGAYIAKEPFEWKRERPLPNVWLGVSVEDQATADERIPELLSTPAALRFVSYEPALGPIDFGRSGGLPVYLEAATVTTRGMPAGNVIEVRGGRGFVKHDGNLRPWLDWVIVGGESGPGARPFDVAWARSTIAQCRAAGTKCFVKQLGAWPVDYSEDMTTTNSFSRRVTLRHRKGSDPSEWPADLRVREFPT